MIAAWKPPPLVPVMLTWAGVDLGPRQQVVDRTHAVPHFPSREAGAGEVRQVAEHRVLAADQVVAAALPRRIPELAAFALAHRIPADDDVAASGETLAEGLVVRLAVRRVAARHEHRRMLPGLPSGTYTSAVTKTPGQALEDDLLDVVAGHLDPAGHLRVQRSLRGRQAAERAQQLAPEVRLHLLQICFRADCGEPGAAVFVLPPRHVDLIREVRRDTRPVGLPFEHGERALRRRLQRRRGSRQREQDQGGGGGKHHSRV